MENWQHTSQDPGKWAAQSTSKILVTLFQLIIAGGLAMTWEMCKYPLLISFALLLTVMGRYFT